MGWENRNGQLYFYRKFRIGRLVRSEYCGRGEGAQLIAQMQEDDPLGKVIDRFVRHDTREYEESIVQRIEELERDTNRLVLVGLINCGYRQHKGQWRKRRHEKP